MSLERALTPLAIAISVVAAVVWLLLVNDIGIGAWLLALLVLAHGWVHLVFVFPRPERGADYAGVGEYPFDFGRSWLIRRVGLDAGIVRAIGLVAVSLTFATALLAALATVSLLVPAEWWAPLMIAAALASAVTLTLFFSPALVLGYAIDALMLALVVGGSWSPS